MSHCSIPIFVMLCLSSTFSAAMDLPAEGEEVDVEAIIKSMTTEEKVGQLLMVGFGGTEVDSHIKTWVKERKVGGVALFSRNIVNLEQTVRFARQLHDLSSQGAPLFLALDQEGGNVRRVKDGAMQLPGNMALGATRSSKLAYVAGQSLGTDLRRLGFNMNLAPVLDVNSNPKNPVIGVRSYGERPHLVGQMGSWFIRGQQEMGVAAVAKHFPGHGDTQSDSHFAMPKVNVSKLRLSQVELEPFRQSIAAGLDAMMTAHIALPQIAEEPNLPATLSKNVLSGILREELGFEGVVITDGLEMQGIVQKYGSGNAAVRAIIAGADMPMILWTHRAKEEVYASLLTAVKKGTISMARLEQSVRRILKVKAKRGLFLRNYTETQAVVEHRNRNEIHHEVAERIATESITLVRNHAETFPLQPSRFKKVVVLAPNGAFAQTMKGYPGAKVVSVPSVPSRSARQSGAREVLRHMDGADLFVVAAINSYHLQMARAVQKARPSVPVALVSFSSPYYLQQFPNVEAFVCTYSYLEGAQRAAAYALLGKQPMTGRLPVSIPGFYAFGHRVENREVAVK